MNKSIVIINQYIGSPHHGMEYRHYYLAKHLVSLGYKVTLVSGSYSHLFSSPPQVKGSFTRENIDGVEYIWVKVPKYRSSKSIGRIWNMIVFAWKLRYLHLDPAHILVSSPSLFPVRTGKRMAQKFGTKFLFEVRDIWPLTLVELSGLKASHPLIRIMKYYEKFAYCNADKVISLLPQAKEHFVTHGMSESKFVYLPNGIEVRSEDQAKLPSHIQRQIPKDKFIIAYTGTIGIANNVQYLIETAEVLEAYTDIHFMILGQGGEKQKLQEKVRRSGLQNVTFLEPVKRDLVGSFLSRIDVAFISLLPEDLFRFGVSPNKVFEYMYAKKPIIWAIEAGNDPVKEAACGVNVPLNDKDALKEAILELKALPVEKREELGQNGYNFVKTRHSYGMLAKKLMKIIEEKYV